MNLPPIDNPEQVVGLYVVDFGADDTTAQQCAVGYTARQVIELLESERHRNIKIYRIHRARPDGTLELQGVSPTRFQVESGMFFHCPDERTAQADYDTLLDWVRIHLPPCRARLHLARDDGGRFLIALIYPAEYEHEMGQWLGASGFRGRGPVDAGPSQVRRYRQTPYNVLRRDQLFPAAASADTSPQADQRPPQAAG